MAKLFAGDLIQKVVYDCQQFHGGMGYVVESAGGAGVPGRAAVDHRRRPPARS